MTIPPRQPPTGLALEIGNVVSGVRDELPTLLADPIEKVDGVGLERDALADCGALLAGARLLGIGTWAFDGGATPLRQELAHVLIFELQVCMHVIQPCVWFVALYCREQVI